MGSWCVPSVWYVSHENEWLGQGKNVSGNLLEAFADNIAKRVTSGELYVEGMDNSVPRAGETDTKVR